MVGRREAYKTKTNVGFSALVGIRGSRHILWDSLRTLFSVSTRSFFSRPDCAGGEGGGSWPPTCVCCVAACIYFGGVLGNYYEVLGICIGVYREITAFACSLRGTSGGFCVGFALGGCFFLRGEGVDAGRYIRGVPVISV